MKTAEANGTSWPFCRHGTRLNEVLSCCTNGAYPMLLGKMRKAAWALDSASKTIRSLRTEADGVLRQLRTLIAHK